MEASSTVGLVLGMLLAYRYVFLRELTLNQMVLITLLAYLLSTKLVNEQYVLALLPFSYVELHALRQCRPMWRGWRRCLPCLPAGSIWGGSASDGELPWCSW